VLLQGACKMEIFKKVIYSFNPLKQLLASGGLTFIFRIGGLGLTFLVTLLLTRLYGDEVFGSYSLVFTIAQATSLLFALGFPNALISYLGLKSINDPFSQHMLQKGIKILVPIALVPACIYFFGANAIALHIFGNPALSSYIIIAAFTIPVMVLHEFILYFFIATGNFFKFNLFMFVVPNVLLLTLLIFVKDVTGPHTFGLYFLSIIGVLAIESFFAFKKYKKVVVDEISVSQMIRFASPMMFSGIMIYLLNWTDVFILGAMATEAELAHYNLAYKIASLSMLVIMSMNVVLAPRIAALYNEGNMKELHLTVKKTTRLIIVLTLPVVGVLMLLATYILSFFGPEFIAGHKALIIILAGFLVNAMTGNVDQLLNMTGNQKLLQYITIAGFFLNAGLNFALIPQYGINGSAVASLITNVIFNVTCVFFIKKKLGFYTFA